MKIANILAQYSLGDADILRRAMGKKVPEIMAKEKEKFMAGAAKNTIPTDKAEHIFELMAKFAGYGFNKSHSAAYALIAYQTAYLKAHYPAQFMAALLSCDMNNTDKVVIYINECKEHEIDVLPPDINESDKDFTVVDGRIRFGLAAVKNVGESALDSIIEERRKDGPFPTLEEFCCRVDLRRVNRRVVESLIKAGAFDSLHVRRSQLMAIIDQALEHGQAAQRDRLSGQISLFTVVHDSAAPTYAAIQIPDIPEWREKEKLAFEKETVGFYITGHPLFDFKEEIDSMATVHLTDFAELQDGQPVRVGGLINTFKETKSKRGERMGFITLEDIVGSAEIVVFPDVFSQCSHLIDSSEPVIVQGVVKKDERGGKIIAEAIDSLAAARRKYTERVRIRLRANRVNRAKLEGLKKILFSLHGSCPVLLTLHFDGQGEVDIQTTRDMTIEPGRRLTTEVNGFLGEKAVSYQVMQPENAAGRNNNGFRPSGKRFKTEARSQGR
jgi:DNA polymerase-3 subunit alpha